MTHKRREETIRSMESITTQLLVAFYKRTGRKPESIIMYRDGVGEGHFDNVMKYEGMLYTCIFCFCYCCYGLCRGRRHASCFYAP